MWIEVSLILCLISYEYVESSPLTKLRCFINDTVSQQEDTWNCGIYTCWNARCFILYWHTRPEITVGDLYKLNGEVNVVINEKRITSMLNASDSFIVDYGIIKSLRDNFGSLLGKLYGLLTDPTKNEMSSDNADIQMKQSGEDEETVGKY